MIAVIDMIFTRTAEIWAACFGICWLLDTFLFDSLATMLGVAKPFRAWFKIRGFYLEPEDQYANAPAQNVAVQNVNVVREVPGVVVRDFGIRA